MDKAERLSKRVIPILVEDTPIANLPPQIARLNHISFVATKSFINSLSQLVSALRSDIGWVREHTRLAQIGARWIRQGTPEEMLLRGSELRAANDWLRSRTPGSPEPTDLHRRLIAESDVAESARNDREQERLREVGMAQLAREQALDRLARRTVVGLVGAGTLTALSGGLAFWAASERGRAENERRQREAAERNSTSAMVRREAARTDLSGQLVANAASPGEFAADGPEGGNSPYTATVLEALANPETSLQSAMARAHALVALRSGTGQRPFLSTNLSADVYLQLQPRFRKLAAIAISLPGALGYPTPNTIRDMAKWTVFLRRCGFPVDPLISPTRQSLDGSLDRAQARCAGQPSLMVIIYSGVGYIRNSKRYLILRDRDRLDKQPFADSTIPVQDLSDRLKSIAAASVLILDTDFGEK